MQTELVDELEVIEADYTFMEGVPIIAIYSVQRHAGAATVVDAKGPTTWAVKWMLTALDGLGLSGKGIRLRGDPEASPDGPLEQGVLAESGCRYLARGGARGLCYIDLHDVGGEHCSSVEAVAWRCRSISSSATRAVSCFVVRCEAALPWRGREAHDASCRLDCASFVGEPVQIPAEQGDEDDGLRGASRTTIRRTSLALRRAVPCSATGGASFGAPSLQQVGHSLDPGDLAWQISAERRAHGGGAGRRWWTTSSAVSMCAAISSWRRTSVVEGRAC